ncbi:MAG: porin family protein [Alphaproteobacteria bacterium]|nr:porin family protein [Alphaproteobacteria bacterium]
MNKKHILISVALFFSASQDVLPEYQPLLSKNDLAFRVGAGVSGKHVAVNTEVKTVMSGVHDSKQSSVYSQNCRKFQWSPNIELGATIFQKYYLGFSISKHYTNAKNMSMIGYDGASRSFEHDITLKSYTDLFFKLGCKPVENIMLYGLVGHSFANWSHNTQSVLNYEATGVKVVYDSNRMNLKTKGYGFGAGVGYLINKKYSLDFEYVYYVHRPKESDKFRAEIIIPDFSSPLHFESIPLDVQKKVSLSYSTIVVRFSYFFSF